MITASVKILGKIFEAEGETIEEAIQNLKPERTKGVIGVLSIRDGEKVREKVLSKFQVMHLFSSFASRKKWMLNSILMIFK